MSEGVGQLRNRIAALERELAVEHEVAERARAIVAQMVDARVDVRQAALQLVEPPLRRRIETLAQERDDLQKLAENLQRVCRELVEERNVSKEALARCETERDALLQRIARLEDANDQS
ncbi:MAG: hypothetical protein EPN91_05440 [Salinibacterium sp.]|nr:MAG: hypothetical protein EPN91_05440 [Salinibacterium sp.]